MSLRLRHPMFIVVCCVWTWLSFQNSFGQELSIFLDEEPLHEKKMCLRCQAANNSHILLHHQKFSPTAQLTAVPERGYDVLRYDLFMDWMNPLTQTAENGAARIYTGIQRMTVFRKVIAPDSIPALQNTETMLEFDAPEDHIRIDSVFIGTQKGRVARNNPSFPVNSFFVSGRTLWFRDTTLITVYYTHRSEQNNDDGTGFMLYRKGRLGAIRAGNDSVFLPQRLAYTMSQPYGARRWMPCNDVPFDKALVSISVRVPQGMTAVANGILQERKKDSLGGETFVWHHQYPVAPYLMAVSASVFSNYQEFYRKVSNPNDSIPVTHYFWQEDDTNLPLNNRNYNVRKSFEITVGTIAAYARWFGEYPYESYGHVVVQPFFAGGMEHQTMSTINRAWLRGSSAAGIAHEIIHQWYGDKVTCRSWEDIWLNEGTATYGEALWYESWGGRAWNMVAMEGFRRNYFASRTRLQSVYVQNPTTIDVIFNYATTYCKGGWIHHLLRRVYGDSIYFPAMRLFVNRFAFGAATTRDFTTVFSEVIGTRRVPVSVDTLMKEWVYGSGEPVFAASWRFLQAGSSGSNRLQVSLQQIQRGENIPNIFHLPVELSFWKYSPDKRDTQRIIRTIEMNNRIETRTFDLPFIPDSILIDEAQSILCQKITPSQVLTNGNVGFSVYPLPVREGEPATIDVILKQQESIQLDIVNVLGQVVKTVYQGLASEGAQVFQDNLALPIGTYFIRLQSTEGTQIRKIHIMR